jgi:hypothetical protein
MQGWKQLLLPPAELVLGAALAHGEKKTAGPPLPSGRTCIN